VQAVNWQHEKVHSHHEQESERVCPRGNGQNPPEKWKASAREPSTLSGYLRTALGGLRCAVAGGQGQGLSVEELSITTEKVMTLTELLLRCDISPLWQSGKTVPLEGRVGLRRFEEIREKPGRETLWRRRRRRQRRRDLLNFFNFSGFHSLPREYPSQNASDTHER
jgi:hypothetical protein